MRAYELAAKEAKFAETLTDSYGKKWVASPGEFTGVLRLKSAQTSNFYYPDIIRKQIIVLHHTAGVLSGDIGELTKPNNHVSTAFVVARSGQVYQLFNSSGWAYHLGSTALGNTHWSQRSIAVEISNLGGLKEDPTNTNILIDAYNKPYCLKSDTQYYTPCNYRGYKYYATYTDEQYRAVDSLVLNLCRKFNLPFTKLPKEQRALLQKSITPGTTLYTHTNFRSDKFDLPPSFDWDKITGR